jgi:hypothetical protein
MTEQLTKQEMFNRAFLGLRSQNWERCLDESGVCKYTSGSEHCAWGWVDLSLGPDKYSTIFDLKENGIGLAASLDDEHFRFAMALQSCHDTAYEGPEQMKQYFYELAKDHNLEIPEERTQTRMSKALVTVLANVFIALLFGGIFALIGQRAELSEATITIGTIVVGVLAILTVQTILESRKTEDKQ